MWQIAWMDLCMLNYSCTSDMKPACSWWWWSLWWSWIQPVSILLTIFSSMFIKEIGLQFSLCVCMCLSVFIWIWQQRWCGDGCGKVSIPLRSLWVLWQQDREVSSVSFHPNTLDVSSLANLMKGTFSLSKGADDGFQGRGVSWPVLLLWWSRSRHDDTEKISLQRQKKITGSTALRKKSKRERRRAIVSILKPLVWAAEGIDLCRDAGQNENEWMQIEKDLEPNGDHLTIGP